MEITKEWLQNKKACTSGIKWFMKQEKTESSEVLEELIKQEKLTDANWLIVRVMTYKQYVSYAVFAAEQVIDIYEKQHPNDNRPRQAIEAARKCIDNPSEKNKAAAYAASSAASYAADAAAYYPAYAAAAAAYYAAYAAYAAASSAADAADAASSAADASAAAYAAAYAASAGTIKKILKYGIELCKESE